MRQYTIHSQEEAGFTMVRYTIHLQIAICMKICTLDCPLRDNDLFAFVLGDSQLLKVELWKTM